MCSCFDRGRPEFPQCFQCFAPLIRERLPTGDYAIYLLSPEGTVTSWNRGAERFKEYKADEIIGRHLSEFYTPEDRKNGLPARALEMAAREGKYESEGWRVRKDGGRFWAYMVIDPIRMPSGELVGYAKITRDLTVRRVAEESLRVSQEQFRLLVQGVTDHLHAEPVRRDNQLERRRRTHQGIYRR